MISVFWRLTGKVTDQGSSVKLGVLERDRPPDIVLIDLLKALDQMQLIAVLMTCRVEPSPIVEPDRIHDQSVPFPVADGIAEPGGVYILGVASAIGVNDAEGALVLKEDGHHRGRLHDLERHETRLNSSRRPNGQALRQWIIDLVFLFEEIGGIRRKRRLMAERLGNVRGEGADQTPFRSGGPELDAAPRIPSRTRGVKGQAHSPRAPTAVTRKREVILVIPTL